MRATGISIATFLLVLAIAACTRPAEPTVNLYRAIQSGDLDQIKRHLYHGTDVDQLDREGDMPLHVAARRGRLVITRLLLDHGAGLDARNRSGRTPLEEALLAGKIQVARLLVERGAAFDPQRLLFETTRENVTHRDVAEFLIGRGADVDATDADGRAALHIAVALGHRVVSRHLIDQGADVNLSDGAGLTPLAIAKEAGNGDLIRLLQRFGAEETP